MTRKSVRRLTSPIVEDPNTTVEIYPVEHQSVDPIVPLDWRKGALLNVRNYGQQYIITLYPEEYDPQHPERSIGFTNPGECQNFVSKWYARESHDPRAR